MEPVSQGVGAANAENIDEVGNVQLQALIDQFRADAAESDGARADLAVALNDYAIGLSENERGDDAVVAAEGAVGLYRELVAAGSAVYSPDLASALNNYAAFLSVIERGTDALAAVKEAVGLYQDLATANPAYTSALAIALKNYANRLAENGRQGEAEETRAERARLLGETAGGLS